MPVTTRSKRKSTSFYEISAHKRKGLLKLVDITNRKKNSEENSIKSQITSQKSDSVVYNVSKNTFTEELKSKVSNTSSQSSSSEDVKYSQSFGSQSFQDKGSKDAVSAMRKVKKVLSDKFINPAERLQLDVKPNCLFDVEKCKENHQSLDKLPRKANVEAVFVAKLYLTEERHFQFFQHIRRNLIAGNKFPGSDICVNILQEIMVTNKRLSK